MLEVEFNEAIGKSQAKVLNPRFGIYRNNVASALKNSLGVRYPVVEELVGSEFFFMMCREYVAVNKPKSAVLISYGADFAKFILQFEPASTVPYLSDVAELEDAWWRVYHAADKKPLSREILTALAPEAWGETRLRFVPSAQLVKLKYSAFSIWRAHREANFDMPDIVDNPEHVLIYRDGTSVMVQALTIEFNVFLNALFYSKTLLEAVEAALDENKNFDILAAVHQLFHFNIIAELY